MKATTQALETNVKEYSPLAYFTSLQGLIEQVAGNQKMAEALMYCYASLLSKLSLAVI